ncbi:hypothetical protein [Streptomyces sp. NPDC001450]
MKWLMRGRKPRTPEVPGTGRWHCPVWPRRPRRARRLDVLRHEGGPPLAHLRYRGTPRSADGGCFLADVFEPDGSGFLDQPGDLVGPWAGEVPLPGPCLLYARSDGPWSISVRPVGGQA